MNYFILAKETFEELRKNWVLLVPTILMFFTGIIFSILFLYFSGLLPEILSNVSVLFSPNWGQGVNKIIDYFFQDSNSFLRISTSFALFFITNFLVGSSLLAIRFSMMKDIVNGKKASLKEGFRGATNIYFNIIVMRIIIYLFNFILALILSLYLLIVKGLNQTSMPFILFLIGFAIVIIKIILLFRYPIMLLGNLKPIKAVKKTFYYFLERKRRVLFVWLIIFAVSLTISLIVFLIEKLTNKLGEIYSSILIFLIIFYLIKSFLDLIVDIWGDLYIFVVYKKVKNK